MMKGGKIVRRMRGRKGWREKMKVLIEERVFEKRKMMKENGWWGGGLGGEMTGREGW